MGFTDYLKLPGVLRAAAAQAKQASQATQAAVPELASRGIRYVDDITRFHDPAVAAEAAGHGGTGFIDFPGFQAGDRLKIVAGTDIAGIKSVRGEGTLTELSPTSVAVQASGQIGPMKQELGIHVHQLTDNLAEVLVIGIGDGKTPNLANIADARQGAIQLTPVGVNNHVSVQSANNGRQLLVSFNAGDKPSTLVLEKA